MLSVRKSPNANLIHACLDGISSLQLACLMTARHLVSPMWLEGR